MTRNQTAPAAEVQTSLWRHGDFMKLWTGQTVSLFGTLLSRVALPFIAVLLLGATPAQMALLTALRVLPTLLLGLVAGHIVDRVSRRLVMLLADIGRAVAQLWIPLAFLTHTLRLEHLYVIALVVSALDVFFDVAYPAYLPTVVSRDQLIDGNTRLEASGAISEVAGFSIAGFITQLVGAPLALLVDAGTYIVSAISLALIRRPEPHLEARRIAKQEEHTQPQERHAIWRGLHAIATHPLRRALIAFEGLSEMANYMVSTVIYIFFVRDLLLQPALLGSIFAVGGIASFVGTLLLARITRRLGIGRTILVTTLLATLVAMTLPLTGGAMWVIVGMMVGQQVADGPATISLVSRLSLLQATTPDSIQGRVHGAARAISAVATLGGIALGGVLGESIGARGALFVAAGIEALAVVWLIASPVRHVRELPTPAE